MEFTRAGKRRSEADDRFYREWSRAHRYCQACGIGVARAVRLRWPGLDTHHVVGGPSRSHEGCNLLRLCRRCHRLAELDTVRECGIVYPPLTLGVCLTLKKVREPFEWDPGRLARLWHRNLPDPEAVPAVIEDEYRRRRPADVGRFFRGLATGTMEGASTCQSLAGATAPAI